MDHIRTMCLKKFSPLYFTGRIIISEVSDVCCYVFALCDSLEDISPVLDLLYTTTFRFFFIEIIPLSYRPFQNQHTEFFRVKLHCSTRKVEACAESCTCTNSVHKEKSQKTAGRNSWAERSTQYPSELCTTDQTETGVILSIQFPASSIQPSACSFSPQLPTSSSQPPASSVKHLQLPACSFQFQVRTKLCRCVTGAELHNCLGHIL